MNLNSYYYISGIQLTLLNYNKHSHLYKSALSLYAYMVRTWHSQGFSGSSDQMICILQGTLALSANYTAKAAFPGPATIVSTLVIEMFKGQQCTAEKAEKNSIYYGTRHNNKSAFLSPSHNK